MYACSLPFGVQLYDKLVDLPDDLRANLVISKNGYKDLFLQFPEYPEKSIPSQLRLIESFQGNSPANPGHIYFDIPLTNASQIQKSEPVLAHGHFELPLEIAKPLSSQPEINFLADTFSVDENLLPKLVLSFNGEAGKNIIIKDSVLIDQSGQNYGMFHLDEEIKCTNNNQPIEIMYERFPSTAKIANAWFGLSVNENEMEIVIPFI